MSNRYIEEDLAWGWGRISDTCCRYFGTPLPPPLNNEDLKDQF